MDVVRAEEELALARRWSEAERVRVTKRVVTEERTVVVPVRREELVIEQVPLLGGEPHPGPPRPVEPLVLTLSEEQVEVLTRVVPVERVTITVATRTEHATVADLLQKEAVEVEVAAPPP